MGFSKFTFSYLHFLYLNTRGNYQTACFCVEKSEFISPVSFPPVVLIVLTVWVITHMYISSVLALTVLYYTRCAQSISMKLVFYTGCSKNFLQDKEMSYENVCLRNVARIMSDVWWIEYEGNV